MGLIGFSHQTVSHLTGNTSMLAAALANADVTAALHFGLVIGSFLFGTALSGFIIQNSRCNWGHRYGVTMFLESFFTLPCRPAACPANLCTESTAWHLRLRACQNAMVSTYSGTVVRTTHVSGMFTDLGISLGHALRGLPVDRKRLNMCFLVISGFLCGGIAGALLYRLMGYKSLFIPAALTALAAAAYEIYKFRFRKNN